MMHFDLSMTVWPFMTSGDLSRAWASACCSCRSRRWRSRPCPPHLRPEGSSVYTLIRNLGSSVGISIMNALVVANTQTMHASLAGKVVATDPGRPRHACREVLDPSTVRGHHWR